MKRSSYLSLGLLGAVVVWMLSGLFAGEPEAKVADTPAQQAAHQMKVKVLAVEAREITREIVVQGELQPLRQVEVKAQTASRVVELTAKKGHLVSKQAILVRLAKEDRLAQLKRAKAEVINQRLEVAGARKLNQQGLQAKNRLKSAEAALAAAQADLAKAKLELEYIDIKAPFGGILEQRHVELGSHLSIGDSVALVVDESVLKAVGRVSQQSAGDLSVGQKIEIRLLDDRKAEGRVTFVSKLGDSETHSFRIEAEVPNPEGTLNAGVSAEIRIAISKERAHFLSPAVLSLNDKGEVGVKSVDSQGKVHFHAIDLVRTEANGVWVSGLPDQVNVITQGQGFVRSGETVIAVPSSRG